jgi:phage terminase small subunit
MDNRTEAKRLYIEEELTPLQIAERLGIPGSTVRSWKSKERWDDGAPARTAKSRACEIKPGTAPFQPRNTMSTRHGLYARYLPDETRDIIEQLKDSSPIEILWDQIQLAQAALFRAQMLMHVKDHSDHFKAKTGYTDGQNSESERWEVQTAWDRQASFLNAQAKAQSVLQKMIQQYDELCRSELATEEQRARIDKIRASIDIEERRYALEQRKAGMGDDIDSESGIAYMPGVDQTLLEGALPDPEGL